jgi:hypothetical protein
MFPLYQRDTLVARLNRALLKLGPTHTDEIIDIVNVGIIQLRGIDGKCVILQPSGAAPVAYPNTLSLHYVGPDAFSLRVITAPARDMKIPPTAHELPCDLIGMMYHNWGKSFRDSLESYHFWDSLTPGCPHPPSTKTPLSTQRYYMGYADYAGNYRMDTGVINRLQDHSYSEKIYDGFAGTFAGKRLFRVVRPSLEFLAKYDHDRYGNDSNIARPVGWELQFRDENGLPTWDPSLDSSVESIKFITRMQRYPGDNCSYSTSMAPDDSAWVGMELKVAVRTSTKPYLYTTETYTPLCHRTFSGGTADQNNAALWGAYDNYAIGALDWWGKFELDTAGWLCLHIWGTECDYRHTFRIKQIKDPHISGEVCESTYPFSGQFSVDGMTGDIYFGSGGAATGIASRQLVTCLPLCEKISGYRTMSNVLAASAESFGDQWPYGTNEYGARPLQSNAYQNGERGGWRPVESFSYRSKVLSGNSGTQRNYLNAGIFVDDNGQAANAFTMFNWDDRVMNDTARWIRADSVSRYSPDGDAVESKDMLAMYSAVKLAHQHRLPKLVAKNAHYDDVEFESFEDGKGNASPVAHSGKYSYRFTTKSPTQLITTLRVTSQMISSGLQLQFWVRKTYSGASLAPTPVTISGIPTSSQLDSVAKTGAWTLYRLNAKVLTGLTIGDTMKISFKDELSVSDTAWIDDIRVQPLDAEMVCYVYDPVTLRLAATFDDQHFGLYNQYNSEGKLVRQLRETERGMKTVAESQYHTPRVARNYDGGAVARRRDEGGGYGTMMAGSGYDGPASSPADASEPNGIKSDIGLVSIDGAINDPRLSVLGSRSRSMTDADSMKALLDDIGAFRIGGFTLPEIGTLKGIDLDSLSFPALPAADRLALVTEIRGIDSTLERLASERAREASEEGKRRIDDEIHAMLQRRSEILRSKLGLSEEEVRQVIDEGGQEHSNAEESNP